MKHTKKTKEHLSMLAKLRVGERSSNFKDGRTNKKYYCKTCNKEISMHSGFYGKGFCRICHAKNRFSKSEDNPMFGVRRFGSLNPNFKGGIWELSFLIRGIKEANDWRIKIFERDNYTCQECFKYGGDLEAHHIKEFNILIQEFLKLYSQFSPIEDKETLIRLAITYEPFWNLNNGKTLCRKCHKETFKEKNNKNDKSRL